MKRYPTSHMNAASTELERLAGTSTGLILVVMLLVVLSGCSDAFEDAPRSSSGVQSNAAELSTVVKYGNPSEVAPATVSEDTSARARLEQAKQFNEVFSEFTGTIKTAGTWSEANQAASKLLKAPSPVALHYRQQMAANVMLREWLMKGPNSSSKQEATARYTDLLVKNKSPEAAVVARSLDRLKGHWPEARIAEAARSTAREARDALQQEATGPLADAEHSMPATFRNNQERRFYQTRDALSRLEAMSQSGQ